MEKKWKCTVCGYIHTGDEPPETCPVCGADKSKFIEVVETEEQKAESIRNLEVDPATEVESDTKKPSKRSASTGFSWPVLPDKIGDALVRLHAHPISVHIPNGVLPVSVFFLALGLFFDLETIARAAFYNMIVVAFAMPAVIFTGINDWQRRFEGNLTRLFVTKLICGGIVLALAGTIVIWRMIDPVVAGPNSPHRGLFFFLHLVMLGAAVFAGYLGGKLVFND